MDESEKTLAVVEARLSDLIKSVDNLRLEVNAQRNDVVARNEWLQRNAYVDSKFDSQGAEIAQLRTDAEKRRAPWWAIVAVCFTGLGVVWTILGPLLTGR
ncbi:hypothetical protein [Cellulomonas massiliensis]|uniref:hypothetical protein n=1 Tax=Cellulomonas massiliensis TaxID=1465811 RepID=UPI00037D9AA0|nr:hypothetical protein [Cellulomonas massiliensis]